MVDAVPGMSAGHTDPIGSLKQHNLEIWLGLANGEWFWVSFAVGGERGRFTRVSTDDFLWLSWMERLG